MWISFYNDNATSWLKSAIGRFTIWKAKNLRTILSIINNLPNFQAHFFAADGKVGLNSYHEHAFKKFCNDIPSVVKGEIKIDEFLPLERLASHPVEQYFGNYRTHFFGNYQYVSAFKYAIRTILSIIFQNEKDATFLMPSRDNNGSTHLNYLDKQENAYDIYGFNSKYLLSDLYIILQNIYEKTVDLKAKLHILTNQFFWGFYCFIL